MTHLPTLVIGIPGNWADRSAIVESIIRHSGGYMFAGIFLMNIESKWSCKLEIYDNDPGLRKAFESASRGRIENAVLDEIDNHTFTLYLSSNGGSAENALALMNAAAALLDCGGIAVKIESSGLAHTAEQWHEMAKTDNSAELMNAYVTYVGGTGSFYSCGMHSIGFRDVHIVADIATDEAMKTMFALNLYIALENATINDGETFSVDTDSRMFRVDKRPCELFSPDDLFHNPYGIWNLTVV